MDDRTAERDEAPKAMPRRAHADSAHAGDWSLDEPLDLGGRGLEGALILRDCTALRCGDARFLFSVDAVARSEAGRIREIRLGLHELAPDPPSGDARSDEACSGEGSESPCGAPPIDLAVVVRPRMGAPPIDLAVVVRPRIEAATIDKLGPLDLPSLRSAARTLMQAAAAQVAARD